MFSILTFHLAYKERVKCANFTRPTAVGENRFPFNVYYFGYEQKNTAEKKPIAIDSTAKSGRKTSLDTFEKEAKTTTNAREEKLERRLFRPTFTLRDARTGFSLSLCVVLIAVRSEPVASGPILGPVWVQFSAHRKGTENRCRLACLLSSRSVVVGDEEHAKQRREDKEVSPGSSDRIGSESTIITMNNNNKKSRQRSEKITNNHFVRYTRRSAYETRRRRKKATESESLMES